MSQVITRTVWILSLVSLFADVASEMLYPVLPVYLKSIGFSVVLIGVLEGIAEAVAGLSKGYFGKLSDESGKRLPFVRWGYFLSALAKPVMVIFKYPLWVFFARTTDRLGKGLRTGARDAILSGEAKPENKGSIFGFHRSMDTYGAAVGPLLALLYLYYYPGNYFWLFVIAFVPGMVSVFLTFFLREKMVKNPVKKSVSFFSSVKYIKVSTLRYKKVLLGITAFSLVNSSDIFLLLMVKQAGFGDTDLLWMYVFYNLVYAIFAYPFGRVADRIGLKKMFLTGLVFFIITYCGFAFSPSHTFFVFLFFVYGLYAAATDGISKAWISNICDKKDAGVAIGTLAGFQSIAALVASSVTGTIWYTVSPTAAFLFSATGAFGVLIYFVLMKE